MDLIRQSWKAVVAFASAAFVPQIVEALPVIESALQGWAADLITAAVVAVGVWLKANVQP